MTFAIFVHKAPAPNDTSLSAHYTPDYIQQLTLYISSYREPGLNQILGAHVQLRYYISPGTYETTASGDGPLVTAYQHHTGGCVITFDLPALTDETAANLQTHLHDMYRQFDIASRGAITPEVSVLPSFGYEEAAIKQLMIVKDSMTDWHYDPKSGEPYVVYVNTRFDERMQRKLDKPHRPSALVSASASLVAPALDRAITGQPDASNGDTHDRPGSPSNCRPS